MPAIHLRTEHNLGLATAKQRITGVADQLQNRLGVDYHWEGNTLKFNRSGASGTILVEEHAVTVDVDLGMMLTPFKGEVEKQLQGYLQQSLK